MAGKSVFDGIKVKEEGFPLTPNKADVTVGETACNSNIPQAALKVVSACPGCGAPVYGKRTISQGEAPAVAYSCDCRGKKSFADLSHAK